MKASFALGVCLLTLSGCMKTGVHVTRSLNNTAWGYQKSRRPCAQVKLHKDLNCARGTVDRMRTEVIVTETQNAAKSPQPIAGMSTKPFGRRVVFMLNQIS